MKKKTLLSILFISFLILNCNSDKNKETENKMTQTNNKILRHVVLFKFKENTTDEKIKEIEKAFSALPSKISQIIDYEWGINNSPEGLNKGLTHCFFLSFKNEEDRAIYLPHNDHKAFGQLLTPYLDDAVVVDYWTTPN